MSGDGYGYAVARLGSAFVVYLRVGGARRAVVGSFDDVIYLGERFAHAMAQYATVQRRARVLAQGFAVLGS